jgi:hypothetical protein
MWVGIIVIFPILFENAVKVVFIQNQDMVETLFTNRSYPVCCKYSILGNSVDLAGFEPAASSVRWMSRKGKRGKKASITSTMCQNHHTVLAYLFPNCSRIVPAVYPICIGMKQGKAIRSPVQMGIWCKWCPWKTSSSLFFFVPLIKKPVLTVSLIHRIS